RARARSRGRIADGERDPPVAREGRARGRRGRARGGRPLDGGGGRLRRDRARRDASGAVRVRRLPAAARAWRLVTRADAHRPRGGRRPRPGPRQRRRRLPREAVRARGAARAAALARPPRASGAARRPRGGRASPRPGPAGGAPRRGRGRPLGQGVRAARDLHAPARRGAVPARADRARLGHRLRDALQCRRRLRPPAARQARPAVRPRFDRDRARSRLPAAGGGMRRVPIRVRVAAAFAAAMALVLAGTGAFVYARLGSDLSHALDQDLRLRAQDISALVRDRRSSLAKEGAGRLVERGESFAQLVGPAGAVLDATPPLGRRSLLPPAELRSALRESQFVDVPSVPGLDAPARLLATPVDLGRTRAVLVVGATRENRAEALRSLRTELLLAGPIALLLATGLGYVLAGAGLRTVEAMRRGAAEISADRP